MSEEDDLTVWSSMLDGRFTVKVIWIAPYRGELRSRMEPPSSIARR